MKTIGLIFVAVACLLVVGVEVSTGKPVKLNNSSLSLILGDQCVTRDEVRQVIQEEMQLLQNPKIDAQPNHKIMALLNELNPGSDENNAAVSCLNIPYWKPSGFYWIEGANGSASQQYCDMTRTCCGRTGGWMKVADLDMKDTNQQCPSGFRLVTSPRRSCGRPGPPGCVSTTFPVNGVEYSRVCGKIIAYQDRTPDAFSVYYSNRQTTIDENYVNGVSLTHGRTPRKHIWTFAAAADEVHSNYIVCPCTRRDWTFTGAVPPFIGQDYFCDTGSRSSYQFRFYPNDPLWDGQGCGPQSTCCSFNNPPWFCKELPQPTREDIELRLCAEQPTSDEDTPFEVVEIFVQ